MNKFFILFFLCLVYAYPQSKQGEISQSKHANSAVKSKTTTFILIRHAEKESNGDNPNLSGDGISRAEELRHVLNTVPISAIYSTPYNRTRQTVQSLAFERGIPITEYAAKNPAKQLIDEVLASYIGKTVVIVGHSNTVPEIIKTLTNGFNKITISESQYDNMFIITCQDKLDPIFMQLKYGKSTQ
ncbi:phosphoglycerate mutase family protein [Flavobacterium sp. 5]|uniref:phosphoglycerate mutase family protein n=1 Tax=Flavobacterium sp. 5 TaxID=2035199 RepID=UPI0012FDDEBF|nr:phosphoglycerate mutase family protein [Flavobacterium sp. 5]